jgi:hypothetical protein
VWREHRQLGDDGAVFEPGAGGARQAREGAICTPARRSTLGGYMSSPVM